MKKNSNDHHKAIIGIMDSGVGGLSVLSYCQQLLPNESFLYMADSRYAPYGPKTPAQIVARCTLIVDYLISQGAKAIVVACNTATAAAIKQLRAQYDLPIIGMEPAVKPAVKATKNQKIGVLATTGTLKSAQFAALLDSYGKDVNIYTQACEGLVECVEQGLLETSETIELTRQYCEPLIALGVDTIVLGCTHYPFLKGVIQSLVGDSVTIIHTGEAVAKQLHRQLALHHLLSSIDSQPLLRVVTNSQAKTAHAVIKQLLPAHQFAEIRSIEL